MDVQHRHDEWHLPFELVASRDQALAALDDRGVEARPAHVRVDDVPKTRRGAQIGRIGDPARGPGLDQLVRVLLGQAYAHDAAVALQDQETPVEVLRRETPLETVEILSHDRHHGGANRGRREAALLSEHGAGFRG